MVLQLMCLELMTVGEVFPSPERQTSLSVSPIQVQMVLLKVMVFSPSRAFPSAKVHPWMSPVLAIHLTTIKHMAFLLRISLSPPIPVGLLG